MTFLVSLEKMIFILENMVFLLIEKLKIYFCKKVPIILFTFMQTFMGVFIDFFPVKKERETYVGLYI